MFTVTALTEALSSAILDSVHGTAVDPFEAHECVRQLYTWQNVAQRTECVYNLVGTVDEPSLIDRLHGYAPQYSLDPLAASISVSLSVSGI